MGITAGNLRHVINIQNLVAVKASYGSDKKSWQNFLTLRAGVKYLNGSKGIDNNEIFTQYGVEFITYFRDGILPNMRILFGSKTYKINAIAEIGIKEGLIISTELIND